MRRAWRRVVTGVVERHTRRTPGPGDTHTGRVRRRDATEGCVFVSPSFLAYYNLHPYYLLTFYLLVLQVKRK